MRLKEYIKKYKEEHPGASTIKAFFCGIQNSYYDAIERGYGETRRRMFEQLRKNDESQ
jgi:hypothetical protein